MSDPAVTFRLATDADAAGGPDNEPAHVDAYVDAAFRPDMQADEIAREGSFTLLALENAGMIVGYAFVAPGPPAGVEVEASPMEIKRFYIASSHHGTGGMRERSRSITSGDSCRRGRSDFCSEVICRPTG